MSSATTKDGLSDDTLHNTVPSFTLLKIKYKIMIKTVKFGWSQSLTGLSAEWPKLRVLDQQNFDSQFLIRDMAK